MVNPHLHDVISARFVQEFVATMHRKKPKHDRGRTLRMTENNLTLSPSRRRTSGNAAAFPDMPQRKAQSRPFEAECDLPSTISPPLAGTYSDFAESVSGLDIGLEIHGDLAALEREWKAFERHADCTVFQTFDWLAAWQCHIGVRSKTAPAVILGRDDSGTLLFILPLAIETKGLVRRLTWLGSVLCDYNAPLLAKHFPEHVNADRFALLWQDIIGRLQATPRFRFDLVDLQKMPETIGGQSNPFLNLQVLANPSGAYVANLGNDWDAFYAEKRSSSTRKKERQQLKHLAQHGDIRFVDLQDRDDIARTLDSLIDQKTHAFARMGVEDIFTRPGYREFFRDIATAPGMRDLSHVSRLDVGSTMAAANLGLRFRDCYYLIVSSYHDGDFTRFGPGRAHLHELLRHAIGRGFRRFDFTIGDEPYKRDWSDTELRLYDHLAAVTLRGRLVVAMAAAFRRIKRFIKQTPALWHIFSRVRVLAGSIGPR
jgi:CelD/BcsL family acetyltransferase involved in cellulose biosynthesis